MTVPKAARRSPPASSWSGSTGSRSVGGLSSRTRRAEGGGRWRARTSGHQTRDERGRCAQCGDVQRREARGVRQVHLHARVAQKLVRHRLLRAIRPVGGSPSPHTSCSSDAPGPGQACVVKWVRWCSWERPLSHPSISGRAVCCVCSNRAVRRSRQVVSALLLEGGAGDAELTRCMPCDAELAAAQGDAHVHTTRTYKRGLADPTRARGVTRVRAAAG